MTGPLPGPDASARLDRWVADAKAKAQRYQAMSTAAQQVAVHESSADGLVRVTVDSAGNVTDLRLTDKVREMSGDQVAAAVLGTMRRAQAKLADRLGEVMAETIGEDKGTTDTIVGRYRSKFPEPEPEPEPHRPPEAVGEMRIGAPEAPQPKPRPVRRPRADDDDLDDRTYLKRD